MRDGIGPRNPPAPAHDGTPTDVTIFYNAEEEHYVLVPNNDRALAVMMKITPEGCEGMKVGDKTPYIPWIAAYFMAQTLHDQHGLSVSEIVIGEESVEDEEDEEEQYPMDDEEKHEQGVCEVECEFCAEEYHANGQAVRSRVSNVRDAVERVARDAFDISWAVSRVEEAFKSAAYAYDRPSAVYRPTLSIDGNMYCALYGDDLMQGCAGFGDTPDAAMRDFDKNWHNQKAPMMRSAAAS